MLGGGRDVFAAQWTRSNPAFLLLLISSYRDGMCRASFPVEIRGFVLR